jgi:Transposase family tnp2.
MMRWHAEEHKQDGMLRHLADGSLWRNIEKTFQDIGKDTRNVRFGLSTDGVNPFGEMSSGNSTWATANLFSLIFSPSCYPKPVP